MSENPNRSAQALPSSGTHLPALDGLRGVAVLTVLAFHFTVMQPLSRSDAAILALARIGWVGVDLFFVLSGFLITGILLDSRRRPRPLRTFYARRFLRIFPLYYGFLFVLFGLGPLLAADNRWLNGVRPDQLWHWLYLSNGLAALKGWQAVPNLGHLWSLAIEEQFYLLWPLAVLTLSRRRLIRLSLVLLLVSLAVRGAMVGAGASPIAVYALTFTRWDGLVIGALIAILGREPGGIQRLSRWTLPVLGVGSAALGVLFWSVPYRSHYGVPMQLVGYPLVALVFGAILVRTVAAPRGALLQRGFSHRVLQFFGRYSYGIYLLHVPIQGWLLSRGVSPGLVPAVWGSALPGQLIYWAVATTLTVGSAVVVWHFWERPFVRMKKHFSYEAGRATARGAGEIELAPRTA